MTSLRLIDRISVPLVGAEEVAERRILSRRGMVIALVAFALTASLAERVFYGHLCEKAAVHSSSLSKKVQHRDKDASQCIPPVAQFSLLWTAEPSAPSEATEQFHVRLHYDSLYNRPPPLS
jgi:hypothetical protein